ncbi:MAG: sigma-70 family RNA polymerase sigma factor [Prevotella sp.]|nr:sigma-70 family RNA polymerase sigma factor [Prevotella sp.]
MDKMSIHDFEHIALELRPRLLDVGRQFFGDSSSAEDIAQETLMRLWTVRQRIDPQVGVEALAIRMAKNLCISEWRKRQLRTTAVNRQEPADSDDIGRRLEDSEAIARLRAAVASLPPAEQRLFRMRHELEMDISEISATTGIGARSVSAMLSTMKRKLKEMLIKKGGEI